MSKPFHQLFINHFIGSIIGVLVIAGYYDVFNQTFALFDFTLALWATGILLISYAIDKLAFGRNNTEKPMAGTAKSVQTRLLFFCILLSFWLPAILNFVEGSKPETKENKALLTANKHAR